MQDRYDLIVIGLGHAGAECAHAAAKLGAKVLGIDPNRGYVKMSCVPAMGGIAKGQMVREIDALGGCAGRIADASTLQFRMLNSAKGPAVWSPRSQNDRKRFAEKWQEQLEDTLGLDFWQDMVVKLLIEKERVVGIKTATGQAFYAQAVVMTSGTFLNGTIHIGAKKFGGGRAGERASLGISEQLQSFGLQVDRLKTGTSPRLDGRTIDYSKLAPQYGDAQPQTFSFASPRPAASPTTPYSHIGYPTATTHAILAKNAACSPMQQGQLIARGPRYCPSIEDKIIRFPDKEGHRLFFEAEGFNTVEVYINGFSTAMPEDIQYEALYTIPGLAKVKIFRPGYAIAYDYFPPTQLQPTLESKAITGLYFAGQVNGTTGYEEAAAQGLVAGINAYRKLQGLSSFILQPSEAYIGVLVHDLIQKGVAGEPYRMFTSRNPYRISCRQDNADMRLTQRGFDLGLLDEAPYQAMLQKKEATATLAASLATHKVTPQEANPLLEACDEAPIQEKQSLAQLLKRPQLDFRKLVTIATTVAEAIAPYPEVVQEAASIQIKYAPYIAKEALLTEKMQRLDGHTIPRNYDYSPIQALSTEAREKLQQLQPHTIGQASRISGVSPADIAILLVYMGR